MKKHRLVLAVLAGITVSSASHAALIDRGGGLIYDDVQDITWLQDANWGVVSWSSAASWAANLEFGGFDDWRLPEMINIDSANAGLCYPPGCTSELSSLYQLYGINAGDPNGYNYNAGPFTDFPSHASVGYYNSVSYWTGTEWPEGAAFTYTFSGPGYYENYHGAISKSLTAYAWAVRDGDIGAAVVPLPPAIALFAPAVIGMGLVARRRKKAAA